MKIFYISAAKQMGESLNLLYLQRHEENNRGGVSINCNGELSTRRQPTAGARGLLLEHCVRNRQCKSAFLSHTTDMQTVCTLF